jgi:acetyltransferase-like isoleucine patch superfamily enzyme
MNDKKNNIIDGYYKLDEKSSIKFLGKDSYLKFESKVKFIGANITIGSNATVIFKEGCVLKGQFAIGTNCKLVVGNNLKCNWAVIINVQENTNVTIGNDCLFSNVSIYSSDAHSIFDLSSQKRLNHAQNIEIGDRVWLARNVMITKGAKIESDVVVGANSLVTKHLKANSLYAGVPAKLLKSNIIWTSDRIDKFPKQNLPIKSNNFDLKEDLLMKPIEVIPAEKAFSNLDSLSFYPLPRDCRHKLC